MHQKCTGNAAVKCDRPVHPPIVSLEDMGFVPRREASRYIPERNAGRWRAVAQH